MSNTGTPHIAEDLLLRYADGELTEHEAAEIRGHIAGCAECSEAADEYRHAVDAFVVWHRDLKRSLPAPPLPWKPPFDTSRVVEMPRRSRTVFRWGAVAAAAAFAFITWQLSTRQTVSAAELLERASVREQSAPVRRQIQIRTARQTLRRPAVSTRSANGAEADLRALFEAARFSWEDPLSARSFSAWRGQLAQKQDDVRIMNGGTFGPGRYYQIRTTTPEGELAEATITLRATDMLAVRERLQFRNSEWVEITEATDESRPSVPDPQIASETPRTEPPATTAAPVPTIATPADELRVFAALHELGADLGEPVGVRRDETSGKVVVSMLGLGASREQQIRAAIADLANVVIQAEQPEAMRPPSGAARRGATARTNRELESRVGTGPVLENFVNDVLEHSDGALARAHALRNLAGRFTQDVEVQLAPADRAVLENIVRDHQRALARHAERLRVVLKPFVGEPQGAAAPAVAWQDEAAGLVASARSLDAILSEYVAGSGGTADRVAAALADLERRVAASP
jgi:anti-sigma factor RsiW